MLNASDMYCLPSHWEGQPIGLIEAMAMGKAVIATHEDDSKELVEDRVNGLLNLTVLHHKKSPRSYSYSHLLSKYVAKNIFFVSVVYVRK